MIGSLIAGLTWKKAGGFLLGNIKWVILGVGVIAALWYYNSSENEKRTLRENNAKLEQAVDTQKQTITKLQEDFTKSQSLQKELIEEREELRGTVEDLREKFSKNGRDFGNIAKNRPGSVERIINDATKDVFDCFEDISEGGKCAN